MSTPIKSSRHVQANDIRQAAKLAVDATHNVTRIAESVHQAVWATLGVANHRAPTTTRGLTGFVYRNIYRVTALVGKSIDVALEQLAPVFAAIDEQSAGSREREAVIAALNGVMGDRLAATASTFATPMTIRVDGDALNLSAPIQVTKPKTKLILFIHGLCMNDLQWHSATDDVNYETSLAEVLNATPIYLRYNTGLSIAQNGRSLSQALEALVTHWPVKITALTIIAHSMGGLVTRSACYAADSENSAWLRKLKNIVFLGTPHHGAPLERAGHWLDLILMSNKYSRAFTKLTMLRSQGITDLRDGNVTDNPQHTPLPVNVACYAIATTTAASRSPIADRLIGDGLVPLRSAFGQHDDKSRNLDFKKTSIRILTQTNHMALLGNRIVLSQMITWLQD
jgi:pimeloyl-ACP methyl ester carboxylesterase